MPKKTSKSKRQSKLSKAFQIFNPSTPKGKLLTFVLVFALLGGGFYIYKSYAAPLPPNNLTTFKTIGGVAASDGFVAPVRCISVTGQTGFGPLANCSQYNGGGYLRNGYYSPITRKFSPNGGWLKISSQFYGVDISCRNLSQTFRGTGIVDTVFGPIEYGQIYDHSAGYWRIKWANRSWITNNCSTSGSWMTAKQL